MNGMNNFKVDNANEMLSIACWGRMAYFIVASILTCILLAAVMYKKRKGYAITSIFMSVVGIVIYGVMRRIFSQAIGGYVRHEECRWFLVYFLSMFLYWGYTVGMVLEVYGKREERIQMKTQTRQLVYTVLASGILSVLCLYMIPVIFIVALPRQGLCISFVGVMTTLIAGGSYRLHFARKEIKALTSDPDGRDKDMSLIERVVYNIQYHDGGFEDEESFL